MDIKTLDVVGFEYAIMAMRMPMKSCWKSDSDYCFVDEDRDDNLCSHCTYAMDGCCGSVAISTFVVGSKDWDLSMKLIKAGSDHRKHIRLIDAWFEITAPRYWWSEFDTYRYGVDKVSESTMHRILKDEITMEDFDESTTEIQARLFMQYVKDIKVVDGLDEQTKLNMVKANIPEGYLQKRIVKCSYEALRNMYHSRKNHRLKAWREFCQKLETLPYSEFITCE